MHANCLTSQTWNMRSRRVWEDVGKFLIQNNNIVLDTEKLPLLSALVQSHAPRMHASSSHWPTVIQCSARKQAGFYDTICESLCVKQSTTRYDMMSPRRIACTASRLDFYSFSGYEFLISTIQFSLVKMFILDIRNWISTSNNGYFGYQQLHFH